MALFQNKNFLSSNKATIMCGQSDKNVQLPVRPRGLIDVRRKFNLLLHPIVICRLTSEERKEQLKMNMNNYWAKKDPLNKNNISTS